MGQQAIEDILTDSLTWSNKIETTMLENESFDVIEQFQPNVPNHKYSVFKSTFFHPF